MTALTRFRSQESSRVRAARSPQDLICDTLLACLKRLGVVVVGGGCGGVVGVVGVVEVATAAAAAAADDDDVLLLL